MKRKRFSNLIILMVTLLCMAITACNSGDGLTSPDELGKAESPTQPDGEFKFYKNDNLIWSFKVLPSSDPTSAVISVNSNTAQVDGLGNFYYKKLGQTTASVSCFYTTKIGIGSTSIGQWNQYEITLTFLSAHHGRFYGVEKKNPESKGTEISGMFVYDSDLELEEILDKTGSSDNSKVDWNNLTKYAWLNKVSDKNWTKYIFDENGNVIFEIYDSKLTRLSGTYIIYHKDIILQINIGDNTEYKVLRLDEKELRLLNVEFDNAKPTVYKSVSKEEESNGDVKISVPELDISSSSVQVKGTILSDTPLDTKGVLLSLKPNGEYGNCIDYKTSGSDIINVTFDTASGYKYYVRLFAKNKNGKYLYGEEREFTAEGSKVTQVTGKQIYWNPRNVKVMLDIPPYIIKNYGICWGTKPNPTVTANYSSEKDYDGKLIRQDIWELKNLQKNTNYYLRTYHIEGSKIIYYPGEIKFQTLGLDTKINLDLQFNPNNFKTGTKGVYYGELSNVNFVVNWAGLPTGSYKTYVYFFNQNVNSDYGGLREAFFMEGPEGTKSLFANKLVLYAAISSEKSAGSYVEVTISNLDNTPIASAYFKCAWNYFKFVFNPEPQSDRWVSHNFGDSEGALNACMLNE